ncbi:MAG: hypothetical protein ACOYOV_09065 [Bacteroidales bacterium]
MWDNILQAHGHRFFSERNGYIFSTCYSGRGIWMIVNGTLELIDIKEP